MLVVEVLCLTLVLLYHTVLLTPHFLPHTLSPSPPAGSGPRARSLLVGGRGVGVYSLCAVTKIVNVTRVLFHLGGRGPIQSEG